MKNFLVQLMCICTLSISTQVQSQTNPKNPLQVVQTIGDKLIKETPFRYQLEMAKPDKVLDQFQFVNFGRTFSLGKPAVAYAYTLLESKSDETLSLDIEHNDDCKIWLNGELIYQKIGDHAISLLREERSFEMSFKAVLRLKKGLNTLLIKSATRGKEWSFYMQPPATKGAVLSEEKVYPTFAIEKLRDVDARIAENSNWLLIGPFEPGIDIVHQPEKGIEFGQMYEGLDKTAVTWTIPKVEIVGNVIGAKEWGTTYQWNYHNGGVAWAMQQLSETSGNPAYKDWSSNFCDYHLKGKSFVEYQVNTLNEVESANHYFIKVPLLDFTLAPALPFIYRLRKEDNFPLKAEYQKFVDEMVKYARNEQLRYPGSNIYTRTTPQKYTTWVDDMFMGIPFLVQASRYMQKKEDREFFINDAAQMVINFNNFVWDKDANLYMHANYSEQKQLKLPHWSRANGWGIWATTEVLMNLDKKSKFYPQILAHYRTHVASLVKYQTEKGFWRNVLDKNSSPEEVSGTAIFTMAIARGVANGWLDAKTYKPIAMKGWDAVQSQVDADGTVHNICVGTMCSEDVNYYINRPFYDNDTHGLFAVLFAGIDVYKMLNNNLVSLHSDIRK